MSAVSSQPSRARPGGLDPEVWVVVAGIAVAFVVQVRAWPFLADDAFISFRYAQNLAEHGSLAFNPGMGPPVEGYTDFLWVLVLAAGAALGWPPHVLAPVWTVLAAAMVLVLLVALLHALRRAWGPPVAWEPDLFDLVPAGLAVVTPEIMVWAHGGLETSFALAWSLAAMLALVRGRWLLTGTFAAAAVLSRPDAAVPVGSFALCWGLVWFGPRIRSAGWQAVPAAGVTRALAVFVVPVGAHLLWRRMYYGVWLPNTWAIKSHGHLLRETWGVAYVSAWIEAVHLAYLAPLLLLVRARHVVVAVPAAVTVIYVWSIGGDFMAYGRFLIPATALLLVLVGWLLADLRRLLARRLPAGWAAAIPWLLAAGLLAMTALEAKRRWELDRRTPEGWLHGRWEGVTAMDRFARVRQVAGGWMAEHLPPDTLITVGAAGALPYAAGLPTLDAFGLVDPAIAELPGVKPRRGKGARPGHQLWAPLRYMRRRDPDLWCHVGYHGERRPSRARIWRPLRATHVWACVRPGPVSDPRGSDQTVDIGYYCCLRPKGRVVGPFGVEGSRGSNRP